MTASAQKASGEIHFVPEAVETSTTFAVEVRRRRLLPRRLAMPHISIACLRPMPIAPPELSPTQTVQPMALSSRIIARTSACGTMRIRGSGPMSS